MSTTIKKTFNNLLVKEKIEGLVDIKFAIQPEFMNTSVNKETIMGEILESEKFLNAGGISPHRDYDELDIPQVEKDAFVHLGG